MTIRSDFYADAAVYDILHAPGTKADVAGLERIARRFVRTGCPARGRGVAAAQAWLEPACGSGRYLIRAAELGYRCVGFDIEPGMVRYAQARAKEREPGAGRVRIFAADMRDFDQGRRLGRFDFAFNLINTVRHLSSDGAMRQHFAAVARVLKPGGVYAVGISLAAYGLEPETEDTWVGKQRGVTVTQVVQYIPPTARRGEAGRVERVLSHLTIRSGRGKSAREEHRDSTYALRSYGLEQWRALVENSALRIVGVTDGHGQDATASEPGYFVFVLGVRAGGAGA